MLLAVLLFNFVCCLYGRPTSEYILEYARRHPNTDPNSGEYGDLYQGDIILDGELQKPEVGPMNIIPDPDGNLRWTGNIVPYEIRSGDFNEIEIEDLERGIQDLMESTQVNGQNCIQLVPRTNEANYVEVIRSTGCSSAVGMRGGRQTLTMATSCWRHGTIMHEFLHALGYYHEHSRADRDEYVFINYDNIQSGTENNFNKYIEGEEIDHLGTPYDYGGVMHYHAYGFAVDPDIPTIIPLDPDAEIGQRTHLSEYDIERVQVAYQCLPAVDSKHFKHLAV